MRDPTSRTVVLGSEAEVGERAVAVLPEDGSRHLAFWEYKVLIAVSPSYTGPFTVEGKQIDGPDPVDSLIENEQVMRKLVLPAGFGWHYYPTSVLLRSSGCYGLRSDGTSFSSLVYFKVVSDATYRKLTGRSRA